MSHAFALLAAMTVAQAPGTQPLVAPAPAPAQPNVTAPALVPAAVVVQPAPVPVTVVPQPAAPKEPAPPATLLEKLGAGGFGLMLGWLVYYINRYRKSDVQLGDLTTLIGVLGGGAVLALFPAGSELFGAYGLGLALGFFAYYFSLLYLVKISDNFDADWFLDGRRKDPAAGYSIPGTAAATVRPMAPAPMAAPGGVPLAANITILPGSQMTVHTTT